MHWFSKSLNDILSPELKDKHFSLFTIPKNSRKRINYPYLSNMLVFFSSMMRIVPVNCDFRNFTHECDN
jgi:hypothetical protein